MKPSLWNIKIPTYIGFLLLFLVLGITIILLRNNSLTSIKAIPSSAPAIVRITNITDSTFTVSYTTSASTSGSLSYGETQEVGTTTKDDKDENSTAIPHQAHYFTVKNVKSNTTYYFKLLSGNTAYDNNGEPYKLQTAPTISSNSIPEKIIAGKILLPDGSFPKEAIAYAQVGTSQLLSVPVMQNGTYKFVLKNLRTQNLQDYKSISDTDIINITVVGDGRQATATVRAKDAQNVPPITLSNAYTFTSDPQQPTKTATDSAVPKVPPFSSKKVGTGKLEIIVPQANESFADSQPEISGLSLPNNTISLFIQEHNSDKSINETVISDALGQWRFRPTEPLPPGIYTLSVSAESASGDIEGVVQSFGINAQGSQFTDPSVEPTKPLTTVTLTPTATLAPTLQLSNTPVPTASLSATESPTIAISPTTISATNLPSAQPSIPAPGSNDLYIAIGFITFATIISSILFLLVRV